MMTQRDKLLAKIQNNPRAVTFQELDTLLRQHGFSLVNVAGSHYEYKRKGFARITVAYRRRHVNALTVGQVLKAVELVRAAEDQKPDL